MERTPHEEFLASYETTILNHAEYLEPLLRDRGIFRDVSTVLSIGIGAGHLECQLVRKSGIALSYVERSQPMIEAIRRNMERYGLSQNVVEAFEGSFEDAPIEHTYDLVLSLDSWYHIGRHKTALEKALSLRAPGGRLLIQLMNQDRQLYWVLDQVRGLMSSNDLSAWALEQGFEHGYFEHSHWVPVSRLAVDGRPTDGFKHFVAFAKGQAWDELSDAERDEAVDAVHTLQRDGALETRHGYLLFD